MTIQFNVRLFLRSGVINRLLKFSDVTIVLFWSDKKLEKELKNIGCNVLLQKDVSNSSLIVKIYRSIKNILHNKKNIDHSAFKIEQENIYLMGFKIPEENFKSKFYKITIKILASFPFIEFLLDQLIRIFVRKNNVYKKIENLLTTKRCTCMISATPFLIEEELFLLAAKLNDIHNLWKN